MHNGILNGSGLQESYKRKYSSSDSSPVVSFDNVPYDMSDREIKLMCAPFGSVLKIIILKNDQALVEMDNEFSATSLIDYFDIFDICFRGSRLKAEYYHLKSLSSNLDSNDGLLPSPVLNVKIEKMTCPITLDVLYQIFSQHGQVMKIVTFNKQGQFGALIQYADPFQAGKAKMALNGQNIYNNCCTLIIEFHKASDLHISPNDPTCHDYTITTNQKGLIPSLMNSNPSLISPLPNLAAASLFKNMMTGLSKSLTPSVSSSYKDNGRSGRKRERQNSGSAKEDRNERSSPMTCVILASNLSKEMSDPDRIFALFGAFGDVAKVKLLFNKRDAALVQMMDKQQAGMVLDFLNGCMVFGKEIRLTPSKYPEISSVSKPLEELDEEGGKRMLTKDYSNSPLHRYRKAGSKNYKNVCHPTSVLHLSSIPSSLTEDDIKHIFMRNGFTVERFKFLPNARNMALIRLASEEESIRALVLLNDYVIESNNPDKRNRVDQRIRISFSPSQL